MTLLNALIKANEIITDTGAREVKITKHDWVDGLYLVLSPIHGLRIRYSTGVLSPYTFNPMDRPEDDIWAVEHDENRFTLVDTRCYYTD